jgi:hypothetical protein
LPLWRPTGLQPERPYRKRLFSERLQRRQAQRTRMHRCLWVVLAALGLMLGSLAEAQPAEPPVSSMTAPSISPCAVIAHHLKVDFAAFAD